MLLPNINQLAPNCHIGYILFWLNDNELKITVIQGRF